MSEILLNIPDASKLFKQRDDLLEGIDMFKDGFNVVKFGNRYFIVKQGAGKIDPLNFQIRARVDSEYLSRHKNTLLKCVDEYYESIIGEFTLTNVLMETVKPSVRSMQAGEVLELTSHNNITYRIKAIADVDVLYTFDEDVVVLSDGDVVDPSSYVIITACKRTIVK